MSSPLLALSKIITIVARGFLLVVIGVAIFTSSVFMMLPPSLPPNQQSAFGTFPGENGKIAFRKSIGDNNKGDIYVINPDGSGETRLTDAPADEFYPTWSPDGTRIAFVRHMGGYDYEIYTMNADGSEQTNISNNPAQDSNPSWSPDGTKIAFDSDRDSGGDIGNSDIYVMNADGSGQTNNPITHGFFPDWSPDGTRIAFTNRINPTSETDIFVINTDGTGQTRLTTYSESDYRPSWSPDGTKIAFFRDTNGNNDYDIFIMNADGSGQTRLTNNPNSEEPSWSPDGTKIAFWGVRPNVAAEIYLINADGSGETRVTNTRCCVVNMSPDFGPATEPPEEDTTPPVLTVPDNMVVEATSPLGAKVNYTVTAQDNVDGNATLEEDGTTVTQDDVGGNITISCEPPSGSVFPIGDTEVECSATDEAGNTGTESFTVTVNPPTPPPPTPIPKEVIDELISTIQNLDDDNVPQSVKASLIATLKQVSNILNDNNPNNDESACDELGAFINRVNTNETRGTLTAEQADTLRTQAEVIMNQLYC